MPNIGITLNTRDGLARRGGRHVVCACAVGQGESDGRLSLHARQRGYASEQKGSGMVATLKKHGSNKQNEDWYGSERRGRFAAFPSHFSAAKVFYDLRLDLRIEHLPILRGYGSGRRGEDYQRDADMRHLRGRCAALRLQRTLGRGTFAAP